MSPGDTRDDARVGVNEVGQANAVGPRSSTPHWTTWAAGRDPSSLRKCQDTTANDYDLPAEISELLVDALKSHFV